MIAVAALLLGWCWLAGVAVGPVLQPSPPLTALVALTSALLGAVNRRLLAGLLAAGCVLALAGGAWRYDQAAALLAPSPLAGSVGEAVSLRGTIAAEPTPRGQAMDLVLDADERLALGAWQPTRGRLLVRTDALLDLRLGDRVEVVGALEAPVDSEGFAYRDYLARQGIHALLYYPRLQRLGRGYAPGPLLFLAEIRSKGADLFARALPEPTAALARGIVLGDRATMPKALVADLSRTNTTHLIAISGMNIALVVGLLAPLARRLPGRWLGLAATLLGIALYGALVGATASVVRAVLMGGLAAWGRALGRPNDALVGLSLAGAAMTYLNPLWLADLGFQLSFLATAGLVLLAPPIESRLGRLPEWLRSSLGMTLAAQLAATPVLALAFGQVSLVAPLANLLAAPSIAPATVLGLATLGAGLIWQPLAIPLVYLTWLPLASLVQVVELTARIPSASVPLPLSTEVVVAWYACLLVLVLRGPTSPFRGLVAAPRILASLATRVPARAQLVSLAAVAILAWVAALGGRSGDPTVTFLDVGQGDAILVRSAGRVVLIDGGPDPAALVAALDRRLPLFRRKLDLVVLTHAHDDHLAGLTEVLARYEVGQVLAADVAGGTPAVERWNRLLAEKGVPRVAPSAGETVDLGDGLRLTVLHPAGEAGSAAAVAGGEEDQSENDRSVVLRLERGTLAILLTGDVGPVAQREMLARGEVIGASVLKVPHHGAANGLDADFLRGVSPRVAVVSVGAGNRFGHPAPSTLEALRQAGASTLLRTDLDGAVELVLADDGLRLANP